ncbi:unnamed protein product [Fusarium graminearum]|uniref:Chromosome 1, complete genome n=1 Tax=Gibberella zeae (strain ATCC MYA-4620 / CBS 123657 / FGSC 9075 / NRRL 31084 / PH-1) TaxID=229533 RepID=A0A098D296_GIBZE|nr:unnamed protein product [Fusarium graminearum]CZS76339.1 unnamed protein product [Fusarium graminearum]
MSYFFLASGWGGLRLVSVQQCYGTVYWLLAGEHWSQGLFRLCFRGSLQQTGSAEGQTTQSHRHMVSDLFDLGYFIHFNVGT